MFEVRGKRQFRKFLRLRELFLLGLIFVVSLPAWSQFANTAFFKHRVATLGFSTTSQTVLAGLCSSITTVQTPNAAAVGSNLSVTLTGPAGVTFYSDADCTSSISSVTILSGNGTASFYFTSSATGTVSIKASATGYGDGNQSETISTNGFIWTGAGGNAFWATAANWSGGVAPSPSDIAVFNETCVSNCSPSITSNVDVKGVRIQSTYSGTITQTSGFTMTVGSKGWIQTTGTFVGSSSGNAITVQDIFKLSGGTFTATSGTFSTKGSSPYAGIVYKVSGSGTFNPNTGTVLIDGGCAANSITFGSATYQNVRIQAGAGCPGYTISDSNVTIAGNLSFGNFSYGGGLNGGTLSVGGDVNFTGPDAMSGSAVIKLTGNAAGQTITSTNNGGVSNLTIATGANPVTFVGTIVVYGNYIATGSGTLTATGSTLQFQGNCETYTLTPGSFNYNNVKIGGACLVYNLGGGTMNINGDLTLLNSGYGSTISNGTLSVAGNISATGPNPWNGSAIVKLIGRVSGQTVTGTGPGYIPNLTIDVGSNPVTLSGSIATQSYVVTSYSTLTTTGSTLRTMGPTVTVGSENYNNITIGGSCAGVTLSGTLKVLGNLAFSDGCNPWINGGTIQVAGNINFTSWGMGGGSTNVTLNGTSQQTITAVANSAFPGGTVTLNNSAGVLFASDVSMASSSLAFTVSNGDINMAGYSWTVKSLSLNTHVVTRGGGTLTVNGSAVPGGTQSLYGGTINP